MSNTLREIQINPSDSKPDLSPDNIKKYYIYPIKEAAKLLGCCTSVLKKIMRKNGIKRWPYRKIKSLNNIIAYGNPGEQALAISKRELLFSDPNVSYNSLISKSKLNSLNSKINNIHTREKKSATNLIAKSNFFNNETSNMQKENNRVTKKTVELKIANKLPFIPFNSQHHTVTKTVPIFKNIVREIKDSVKITSTDEIYDSIVSHNNQSEHEDVDLGNFFTDTDTDTTTAIVIKNDKSESESDSEDVDPDMLFIDETPSDNEMETDVTTNMEREFENTDTESDSEDIDPDMLFIDETPSDNEEEIDAKTNEERDFDRIDRIRLTHGEIRCSQSQKYCFTDQHYIF